MSEKPENKKKREQPKKRKKLRLTPRRIAWIVFLCVVVLAVVAAAVLPGKSTGITLPQGSAAGQAVVTEKTQYHLTNADITKENVQQVIASLERPDTYSVSVTNTLYWNGAWNQIHAVQYVRDGVCLTEYYDANGNAERFEAVKDAAYYAWRRGGTVQYSGAAGVVSADAAGMIPTYETVIEEDPANITEAGLRTVNGESCIYATVSNATTGYSLTYWVSTVSGLLVQADYTRSGELVRSVVVDNVQQVEPAASLFVMPNGTSLLPEESE
ncbi:MAG: hypothetical protein Q4P20_03785 [Eubacteriales bacterium]|nr:hypothetical protein [Eubacteriales bacterium]